jgi:hypothetical protein
MKVFDKEVDAAEIDVNNWKHHWFAASRLGADLNVTLHCTVLHLKNDIQDTSYN